MRITRSQMFMEIAHVVAKRATCQRLSVGAVIVSGRNIVSIGYNGVPAGEPHCAGNDCPGKFRCELTTHAEVNAVNHMKGGPYSDLDLYVTDSPCPDCYAFIRKETKISRIFFSTPYRITDHLEDSGGMSPQVFRITPSGYIMNWRTKELVDVET